ncbi:MAG: DUF4476 domain-containing protein [Ilyomonas sp.]
MKTKYKFLIFFFLLMVVCSHLFAQEKHFIYIQADNKQPFYVILNGKNYSSSSIGYIILSKLDNGNYTITVGFPKNIYPEQKFDLKVDSRDYGYALKNLGDKGWGLFDLKTLDVVKANTDTSAENVATTQPAKPNPFGEMLSDVVNDSTLTKNNAASGIDTNTSAAKVEVDTVSTQTASASTNVEEEKTPDSTTVATTTESEEDSNTDSTAVAATETTKPEQNEDTSASLSDFDTKGIIKAEESNTTDGTNLVFIDFNKSVNDTIRVFIPSNASDTNSEGTTAAASTVTTPVETSIDSNEIASSSKTNNPAPASNNIATLDNITSSSNGKEDSSSKEAGKQVTNPFFNGTESNNKDNNAVTEQAQTDSTSAISTDKSMVRSSCNDMVSDKDITKLKRKLVTETETDVMIQTVKKGLKGKCISTDNVRELGRLFISDESRYTFFDAIYPSVYDYGSFSSLENQLFDNYYRNRFKAMLR